MAVRRRLHAAGLRYRVNVPVAGMPRRTIDIAFTRARVAVFIDGCFWHGCTTHRSIPRSNKKTWTEKIARNRARDVETTEHLAAQGWVVLQYWEHDTAPEFVDDIIACVQRRRLDNRS